MFRSKGRNFAITDMKVYPAFTLRIFKGVYGMAAKQLFKATLHSQYVRDFQLRQTSAKEQCEVLKICREYRTLSTFYQFTLKSNLFAVIGRSDKGG